MPHIPVHPSAQKRHRQNLKRAERNHAIKSQVRNTVKLAVEAIAGADAADGAAKLKLATRALQKAQSKGTLHRNTARRQIARLSARFHKTHGKAASAEAKAE
ncbi:MAG: 30S ribosomal protein S20 [Candidatus Binataceae bacterium]